MEAYIYAYIYMPIKHEKHIYFTCFHKSSFHLRFFAVFLALMSHHTKLCNRSGKPPVFIILTAKHQFYYWILMLLWLYTICAF